MNKARGSKIREGFVDFPANGALERQRSGMAESTAAMRHRNVPRLRALQSTRAGASSRFALPGLLRFMGPPELARCASK
jgi:hypothetical protein